MHKHRWKIASVSTLFLVCSICYSYAQMTEDPQDSLPQPPYIAPNYTSGYSPYPPVQQGPPPQTEKPSWFKKAVHPFAKRMSPPIYQVPKVPIEPAKETLAIKDPLIRLAKGIRYEGTSVPPGFYLLGLQPGDKDKGAFLILQREQQNLLTLPAIAFSIVKPASSAGAQNLPSSPKPPETNTQKEGHPKHKRKNTDVEATKDKDHEADTAEETVTANVELSADGQSLILVYHLADTQYSSVPVPIDTPWLP